MIWKTSMFSWKNKNSQFKKNINNYTPKYLKTSV